MNTIATTATDEELNRPMLDDSKKCHKAESLPKIFCEVIKASVPTILSMIFFQLVQLINIYFVGHMSDSIDLAGVGLGSMLMNVFIYALAFGLNGTIETFVA